MRRLPRAVTDALDRIAEAEAAAPIDLALARLVAGLDAERAPAPDADRALALALSAALVSRAGRDGHSAVVLEEHAGRAFPEDAHARPAFRGLPTLPALDVWRRHLDASPTVGGAGSAAPLVLRDGRLAFRRHADAERRLAAALADRLAPRQDSAPPGGEGSDGAEHGPRSAGGAAPPAEGAPLPASPGRGEETSDEEAGAADVPSEAAREVFRRLFPPRPDGALDRQALAAAAALRQRVLFVAGGPGTGKTYTAARLLALAVAARPGLRVALAAPTGKAAARLAESVAARRAEIPDDLAAPVPTEAVTLHRLLGARPEQDGFRHGRRRPLAHDLVLVDEGSMVDLALFDALLDALRPEARLVVLGDPDQLAPVEAGAPFADVCALAGDAAPAGLAAFCAALGLAGVPADPEAGPLAGAAVRLTESRRFGAGSGVGALARAVQAEDAGAALDVLDRQPGAALVDGDPAADAVAWALPLARAVVRAASPGEALGALGRFRLLAAVRRGARGVEGLNAAVERALREAGLVRWSPYGEPFYDGRPVLVTVNDYEVGLQNGDVGVCWAEGGQRAVHFPGREPVPVQRLPPHEPAWALTVHKSQGSEFDAVGAVLPEPGTRGAGLLTRELLYTAATRARASVTLFGERAQVEAAVARRQRRTSGLPDRLAEALGGRGGDE